ncbi:hypothetical protein G6F55_014596 [Rhizopus delemar]|nr:hypothetical protein G6F55_014596 [Rhizopus delemar]
MRGRVGAGEDIGQLQRGAGQRHIPVHADLGAGRGLRSMARDRGQFCHGGVTPARRPQTFRSRSSLASSGAVISDTPCAFA